MIRKLFFLLLVFPAQMISAHIKRPPVFIQAHFGTSIPNLGGGIGFEAGFKYTPYWKLPLYIGFDYTHMYRNKRYTWPEVGDYRYRTITQFVSPLFGVTAFSRRRVSFLAGAKLDFITAKNKLLTDHAVLKDFLLDGYHHKGGGATFFLSANCRVTNHLSVFIKANGIITDVTNLTAIFGTGAVYTILSPKAPPEFEQKE